MNVRQVKILILTLIMAAGFSLLSTPGFAFEQGDWLLRFGVAQVDPDDDSSQVTGIPDSEVSVDSGANLAFDISYMLTQHMAIELLASLPFEHDINGEGSISALGKIADVKQLPPTLSVQYHFLPQSTVRPYVGIGVNYTIFFSEEATPSLEGALGGKTSVDLDDSFGLAVQLGADVAINDKWFANAVVRYIDIDTEATLKTGATERTVDVDIDPWVYFLGVGFKF